MPTDNHSNHPPVALDPPVSMTDAAQSLATAVSAAGVSLIAPIFAAATDTDPVGWHQIGSHPQLSSTVDLPQKPWAVGVVAPGIATVRGHKHVATTVLVVDTHGRCHAAVTTTHGVISKGPPEGRLVSECLRLLAVLRQTAGRPRVRLSEHPE